MMLGARRNGADPGALGANQGATLSSGDRQNPTGGDAVANSIQVSKFFLSSAPAPLYAACRANLLMFLRMENPATPALPIVTRDTDDDKPDQSHSLMFGAADCNARDNGFSSAQMTADGAGG